jgi:hypothetical protein
LPGWSPRAYQTEAECPERKAFAELECRERPLDYPATWLCSAGEPPDHMKGQEC